MEKGKDKKGTVLLVLGVLILITVMVGATFAYFAAQGGEAKTELVQGEGSMTAPYRLN